MSTCHYQFEKWTDYLLRAHNPFPIISPNSVNQQFLPFSIHQVVKKFNIYVTLRKLDIYVTLNLACPCCNTIQFSTEGFSSNKAYLTLTMSSVIFKWLNTSTNFSLLQFDSATLMFFILCFELVKKSLFSAALQFSLTTSLISTYSVQNITILNGLGTKETRAY